MFGLINANARLYSPYLGRFVSPDPLLNSEGGALDYNPYIYARNNPYKYIDRNGEFWWWAIFAAIGAGFNVWQNWDNINSVWDGLFFGAAGAAAGAFGGAVGPAFASGVGLGITGAISGAVSGAMAGFVSSATEGLLNVAYTGDFSKFSFTNCLIQTASSAVLGGIIGGIEAVHDGRSFWHGYESGPTTEYETLHPTLGQGDNHADCVEICCRSLTDDKVLKPGELRGRYNKAVGYETNPMTEGIPDQGAYEYSAAKIGKRVDVVEGVSHKRQYIFDRIKAGDDVGITYNVSGGKHNVLVKKVSQSTWVKGNDLIYCKPKVWVMDPAGQTGCVRRIPSYQYGRRFLRVY